MTADLSSEPLPARFTDRQRRFVEAFFDVGPTGGRFFAAKAARVAGYAWPRQQGARLMTFPHVRAEIDRRQEEAIAAARERVFSKSATTNPGSGRKRRRRRRPRPRGS